MFEFKSVLYEKHTKKSEKQITLSLLTEKQIPKKSLKIISQFE